METSKKMEEKMVRSYVRYLKLQRNMSANTLDAYQRDLLKLLDFLKSEGKDVFLSRLDSELTSTNRSALYLVISPYYKEDLLQRLDRLRSDGATVLCVVPYYTSLGFDSRRSYLTGWEVNDFAK